MITTIIIGGAGIILAILIFLFFINYGTHLDMVKNIPRKHVICSSFKTFKINFYKYEWNRNIAHKYSFFCDNSNHNEYDNFYIHASIPIINGVLYRFSTISYMRYIIFLTLNKTTDKNENEIVNNTKSIRKQKLKKIKK